MTDLVVCAVPLCIVTLFGGGGCDSGKVKDLIGARLEMMAKNESNN